MLVLLRGFGGVLILTKVLSGLLHSNTVIVLQRHKAREQERRRTKKREEAVSERPGQCHPSFLGNSTHNQEKRESPEEQRTRGRGGGTGYN